MNYLKNMKILITSLIMLVVSFLLLYFGPGVSASNLTLITDDMSTDEILQAIGKSPNDYTSFSKSLEDLENLSDSDYATYLSTFTNCYDFVGVGEGVDSSDSTYASTYLIFKSKLSYCGDAYYQNIDYCNLWCGKLDENADLQSNVYRYGIDFLNQKDLTDKGTYYETGLSGCIVSEETTSKGILVYKVRCYSKDVLNNSHRICMENIKLQNGSYYTLNFVQDYTLSEDGSFEVDNNMIPKYFYCEKYDGKIMFVFEHSRNVSLQSINLDGTYYDVKLYDYDEAAGRGYYIMNFDIDSYGTKTYYIKGYKFNDTKVSIDNVFFRYVSTKTSVWVEAEKKLSYGFGIPGGNYTAVSFLLKEKETGKEIKNASKVQCKYKYKNKTYSPCKNTKTGALINKIGGVFSLFFDGSNKEGVLYNNTDGTYNWGFGFKIKAEDFDIIMINYEVENEIIIGSCYENGLHVETDSSGNKAVYDMNGVKHDEYSVGDNDLIKDEDGNDLDTTNPPTVPPDEEDTIITKVKKYLSIAICVFVFFVAFWFLKALGLTQYIGKFIVWLFKIITYPIRWIINKIKND